MEPQRLTRRSNFRVDIQSPNSLNKLGVKPGKIPESTESPTGPLQFHQSKNPGNSAKTGSQLSLRFSLSQSVSDAVEIAVSLNDAEEKSDETSSEKSSPETAIRRSLANVPEKPSSEPEEKEVSDKRPAISLRPKLQDILPQKVKSGNAEDNASAPVPRQRRGNVTTKHAPVDIDTKLGLKYWKSPEGIKRLANPKDDTAQAARDSKAGRSILKAHVADTQKNSMITNIAARETKKFAHVFHQETLDSISKAFFNSCKDIPTRKIKEETLSSIYANIALAHYVDQTVTKFGHDISGIDTKPILIKVINKYYSVDGKARKNAEIFSQLIGTIKEAIIYEKLENNAISRDFKCQTIDQDTIEKIRNSLTQLTEISDDAVTISASHLTNFIVKNFTNDQLFNLLTSDLTTFRSQLFPIVEELQDTENSEQAVKSDAVVKRIIELALASLPENRALEADAKTIVFQGEVYTRAEEQLGKPSAGTVYLYTSKSGKHLVGKATDNPTSNALITLSKSALAREVRLNKLANTEKSKHIVEITGAILTTEKSLLVLQEFATGGPVGGLLNKIKNADIKASMMKLFPKYDPEKASHHLMHGMAQAINDMHNANVIHLDINTRNMFLGTNFDIKLGDFGTAQLQKPAATLKQSPVDNFRYQSPKMNLMFNEDKKIRNQLKAENQQHFRKADGKIDQRELKRLVDAKLEQYKAVNPELFVAKPADDIWSLGLCFYEIVKGKFPYELDELALDERDEFYSSLSAKSDNERAAMMGLNLKNAIDLTIFKMLDPDENTRISAKQVLDSNVFSTLDDATRKAWSEAIAEQ